MAWIKLYVLFDFYLVIFFKKITERNYSER